MMLKITHLLIGLLILPLLPVIVRAQDSTLFPDLPGVVAYIGSDGNVYSLEFDTNTQAILTNDSEAGLPYLWPTWSTDGRLAYFRLIPVDGRPVTEVHISSDGLDSGEMVYAGRDEVVNYAYWSPQNCLTGPNCRDLAVLMSSRSANGLFIRLVQDQQGEDTSRITSIGRPFYYSWSPDGTQMLWQRNQQRLDIYDVQSDAIVTTLDGVPGTFQAPGWSPVDDRWLVGILGADSQSTDLAVITVAGTRPLASGLVGPVAFGWSPDGNYIAYTDNQGPLAIVDAVTGAVVARSDTSGVFAFFWSPDSKHIAFLTLASPPNTFTTQADIGGFPAVPAFLQRIPEMAWSVLDIADGAVRRYGFFTPTEEMLYLIAFFDQFAQSHRVWSPDSRFVIYSEDQGDVSFLNVIDVTQENIVPFAVAEGVFGVWSFH